MNLTSFLQDKHLTIALRGEIDHHSAKDIMRVLGNKIDLYLPCVCVLDFREVTFMDSSGIAIVISALRKMRELNGRLVLRAVPRIRERFRSASLARSGVGRGGRQGGAVRRVRNFLSIASIVTTWTLEDLVESAASMKSRGYSLRGRTAFSIYRFDNRDRAFVLALTALVTLQLMAWLLDQTGALYDPAIVINRITPMSGVFYAGYALLCLLPWLLQLAGQRRWRRRVERRL